MVPGSEGFPLPARGRAFLGFADFDRGKGIAAGDDGRGAVVEDAIDHVREFADVTITGFGRDNPWRFAFFEDFESIGASIEVEVGGGAFKDDRIAHVEGVAFGHDPGAFGVDGGAVSDLVLGDDVIDGAAEAGQTGGENAMWAAEEELDKIGVVDMEVKERASGGFAIEITGAAPTGRSGNAPESGGEGFAVGFLEERRLEPGPTGSEPHAHGRHEEGGGAFGRFDDLVGLGGGACEGFFADDVFPGFEGSDGEADMIDGGTQRSTRWMSGLARNSSKFW